MTGLDLLKLAGLFGGVIAFFVVVILGAMRLEGRRQRRAAQRFAAGLAEVRLGDARGPGAWTLTSVDGRRAGCQVALRPQALAQTVTLTTTGTRMRAMGVRITITGTREVGFGQLEVQRGQLVVRGPLSPIDAPIASALVACDASVVLEGTVARSDYPLPLTANTVAAMLALIDALAPYLVAPTGARPELVVY